MADDKPVADKLGLKSGMKVSFLGSPPPGLLKMVKGAGAEIYLRRRGHLDMIFVVLRSAADLKKIAAITHSLEKNGAMWLLRPRGHKALTEAAVQQAGLDAGLVDVKVVRYDDTYAAEKFVFRLADRG